MERSGTTLTHAEITIGGTLQSQPVRARILADNDARQSSSEVRTVTHEAFDLRTGWILRKNVGGGRGAGWSAIGRIWIEGALAYEPVSAQLLVGRQTGLTRLIHLSASRLRRVGAAAAGHREEHECECHMSHGSSFITAMPVRKSIINRPMIVLSSAGWAPWRRHQR